MRKSISLQKQQGAALAISLFILTIVTFIGVSSMMRSINLEKMANNQFNTTRAFQSAEITIRSAETWLEQLTTKPVSMDACSATPCNIIWNSTALGENYGGSNYKQQWWAIANTITDHNWWKQWGRDLSSVSSTEDVPFVSDQPRFFIEELVFIPDDLNPQNAVAGIGVAYYRITAKGVGSEATFNGVNPNQVQLQSIFSKRFN